MTFRIPAVKIVLILIASAGTAVGQSSEEIRKVIGQVDINSAFLFTANRHFHSEVCPGPYKFEGHASIVSRLEYGGLSAEERQRYEAGLIAQARSNIAIWQLADSDTQKASICLSIEDALGDYIFAFMERHPDLVEVK